jgi:peptidoglycan/xylan/chitin deacetylase (PgdA/CDA1 family)
LALLGWEAVEIDGFEGLERKLQSSYFLPPRYVVLTLDDGRESALWAAEALAKHSAQATFFFTRDRCLSEPGYIREMDIRELRKRGFSVGTHGTTHRGLTFLSEAQCVTELAQSKRWLEDVIGEEVRYMAAPGGFINARVTGWAYECGYTLVGTSKEWLNSPETMLLPHKVNRVYVRRSFSRHTFRHIIQGYPNVYVWRRLRDLSLYIPKQLFRRASTERFPLP